ncbi:uncharacterized protein C8A04DRAFT_27844 [Dichotomopilus funicola]|uniref:Uncharacterized protein n=1 Tax=Dichotomopilus funicola TaxID=1934379 RepID=A0AAN6V5F1_9PEZI|nr:hypothetical protein C8A04DRAFT_27844 [Dichotomopilus funicola]
MASQLARPSIGSLQAAFSSCRISTTTKATTTATPPYTAAQWRNFSTTPTAAQGITIPPESPKYIRVPEPPQASEQKLPRVRGHLPIPRDLFPKRDGNRKAKPEFTKAANPLSKSEAAGKPPRSEEEARHRVFAAARREAMASGLQDLYARKKRREGIVRARGSRIWAANKAAAMAPERLDDILTRPTVRAATALQTAVLPDPERFEKAEAARARHAARMAAKEEEQRDALAQLYVAARDFIVDEAALEERIENIFTPRYHNMGSHNSGVSIWDSRSAPVSTGDLRANLNSATGKGFDTDTTKRSAANRTLERQKTVAEELTGGKL